MIYPSTDVFLNRALKDAADFQNLILTQLDPRPAPSYQRAALLSSRAVEEIILGNLFFHISGRSVSDGKSRFEKSLG